MILKSVFNYVQITYQGKELIKYVSEELPMPPDPDVLPQQHQPCLSGMCRPTPISQVWEEHTQI